jgi:hypothetical protein
MNSIAVDVSGNPVDVSGNPIAQNMGYASPDVVVSEEQLAFARALMAKLQAAGTTGSA